MTDRHPASTRIGASLGAPVSLGFDLLSNGWGSAQRGLRADLVSLLRLRPKEQMPKFSQAHGILLNEPDQLRQGVAHPLNQVVILGTDP